MNEYFNKIMSVSGAEDFKAVIKRWNNLSENIKVKPANKPIILPDMLWVARSGVGITTLLSLLSEYLYKQENLMDFYGDVKYFEFMLGYCNKDEAFTELQRLTSETREAAGFRNEYKGIIHIDINEWLRHLDDSHFISFMEYLSSNSDNWLVILSAFSNHEDEIKKLKAVVSMYLRIETVTIQLPETETLLSFVEKELGDYGINIDSGAKALLTETINKLRGNKYFDGYKSLKLLCQDIVYTFYSECSDQCNVLTEKNLEGFSVNSRYIEKMIYKIENIRKIGFAQ